MLVFRWCGRLMWLWQYLSKIKVRPIFIACSVGLIKFLCGPFDLNVVVKSFLIWLHELGLIFNLTCVNTIFFPFVSHLYYYMSTPHYHCLNQISFIFTIKPMNTIFQNQQNLVLKLFPAKTTRTIFQNQQIMFLDTGKEDLPRRWTVRSIGYGPRCKKWAFPLD